MSSGNRSCSLEELGSGNGNTGAEVTQAIGNLLLALGIENPKARESDMAGGYIFFLAISLHVQHLIHIFCT